MTTDQGKSGVIRIRPAAGALLAGITLVVLTALPQIIGRSPTATAVADLSQLVAATAAAVACWRTSRSTSGRMRKSWAAIALGCGAWAAGQAVWTVLDLIDAQNIPNPSLADVGFLLFP